jgi:2-C-methyl-D-erythritol 4-phosphate cytidylyltransferase
MIDGGEHLHMVEFDGQYLNITYPEDIEIAEKVLKDLS